MDNVLVIDDALTLDQCDLLISKYSSVTVDEELNTALNYRHVDIPEYRDDPTLSTVSQNVVAKYIEFFPTINMTKDRWFLDLWRFKHFPPDHAFSTWHSEHAISHPYRIASVMLYLSDHNCGTEFFSTKEVIMSKKGRAVLFPAFWTHTHRGQLCPDKKDRFIMTSYINLCVD